MHFLEINIFWGELADKLKFVFILLLSPLLFEVTGAYKLSRTRMVELVCYKVPC